jgi:hypothetical protein
MSLTTSFGATGVARQGLQRLGSALHRFGVLDERSIADKGCGVEEAQRLPEGRSTAELRRSALPIHI